MSLHMVFSTAGWAACQARRLPEDVVLFIGDGVYCARSDTPAYALSEDLDIRGVSAVDTVTTIDYAQMVELCTQHQPIVSWKD